MIKEREQLQAGRLISSGGASVPASRKALAHPPARLVTSLAPPNHLATSSQCRWGERTREPQGVGSSSCAARQQPHPTSAEQVHEELESS